jgi:hypothetical protein
VTIADQEIAGEVIGTSIKITGNWSFVETEFTNEIWVKLHTHDVDAGASTSDYDLEIKFGEQTFVRTGPQVPGWGDHGTSVLQLSQSLLVTMDMVIRAPLHHDHASAVAMQLGRQRQNALPTPAGVRGRAPMGTRIPELGPTRVVADWRR